MGAKENAEVVRNIHQQYDRAKRRLGAFSNQARPPRVSLVIGGDAYKPEEFGLEEVAGVLLETARRRQEHKVAELEKQLERMAAAIIAQEK